MLSDDQETRLRKLELDNRRMKRLGALALLAIGAAVVGAPGGGSQDVMEAREFRLVDELGRTRAAFVWDANDEIVRLGTLQPDGTPGTTIVMEHEPGEQYSLLLLDGEFVMQNRTDPGNPYLKFLIESEEGAAFEVAHQNGGRFTITAHEDGAELFAERPGGGSIFIGSNDSASFAEMGVEVPPAGIVVYSGELFGDIVWSAPPKR